MASFREVRDLLLDSFDDGELSEDEFLLLYDLNTFKILIFRTSATGNSPLMTWTTASVLPNFVFIKLTSQFCWKPFSSPRLSYADKEQNVMVLKGFALHWEELHILVDTAIWFSDLVVQCLNWVWFQTSSWIQFTSNIIIDLLSGITRSWVLHYLKPMPTQYTRKEVHCPIVLVLLMERCDLFVSLERIKGSFIMGISEYMP